MLYHGDCYEILKNKIDNDSIELVVTDPPYDLSGTGGGFMKKENKKHLDELKELKSTSFEPPHPW